LNWTENERKKEMALKKSRWKGEEVAASTQIRGGGGRRESAGRRKDCLASCHEEKESPPVEVEDDSVGGVPFASSINVVARLAGPTCQTGWLTPSTLRAHPVSGRTLL